MIKQLFIHSVSDSIKRVVGLKLHGAFLCGIVLTVHVRLFSGSSPHITKTYMTS